jgi:hypothetical protein
MGFASPTQGRESPYPYVGVDGPSDDGLLTFAEYVDRGNYDNELLQYTSLSEGQGAKLTHMPPQPTVCLACRRAMDWRNVVSVAVSMCMFFRAAFQPSHYCSGSRDSVVVKRMGD